MGQPVDGSGALGFSFDWQTILNIVLGVVSTIGGGYWLLSKRKLGQVLELLGVTVRALDDNKISPREVEEIQAKYKALISK